MPAPDTRNYDYPVLQDCISMMKSSTDKIRGEVEQLRVDVAKLLESWGGATADDGYNREAKELEGRLEERSKQLELMRTRTSQGTDAMQLTDKRGVGHFG